MSEICMICDSEKLPAEGELTNCKKESYDRVKEFAEKWSRIGVSKYVFLHEKLLVSPFSSGLKYHRNCYIGLTHKNNLQAAQKAFDAKNGSERENFRLCIVCTTDKPKTSKVSSLKVANDILELKESENNDLRDRLCDLNTPNDVIDSETRYHSKCVVNERKKIRNRSSESSHNNQICDYSKVNNEFLKALKFDLTSFGENSPTVDMIELVERYEHFLSVEELPSPVKLLRPYVKNLLESDEHLMSQIDFYHYEQCKPTVIANKLLASKLVCAEHFKDPNCDENSFLKTGKAIRKELAAMKPWEFNGTFYNFDNPPQLYDHVKFIISSDKVLDERKRNEVDTICSNITQYMYSNFKSDRQLLYKSTKDRGFEKHRLTPMSVGTALANYQRNKSKTEIQALSAIGLTINYDSVQRILTGISETAIQEASNNEFGIILPSCIKKGIRPVFAADNIDLGSDAGSFHGADLMIVQRKDSEKESVFPEFFFESKSKKRGLKLSIANDIDENVELTTENVTKFRTSIQVTKPSQYSEYCQQLNNVWLFLSNSRFTTSCSEICNGEISVPDVTFEIDESDMDNGRKTSKKADKLLSWSTFHSNLSPAPVALSNVAIVAPLYRRSPTNPCVLMDILKRAMNITVLTIGPGKRTIITFDGDLYNRAVKIPNYKENWIIRLGSLHVIIAALKCLGKFIEGSGIDAAWEASGMFGSATVNQVIEGRHIYRGVQVHTITLMALHHLYIESILTGDEKSEIEAMMTNLKKHISSDKPSFIDAVRKVQREFESKFFFEKLEAENNSGPTAKFLRSYMKQVTTLLNYIAATRNRDWRQHLGETDNMTPYVHVHDQSNYAKWLLLYLADMLELEIADKESWDFLNEGNFCVSKNEIPFTSIDPDHAIEHEHKPFKVRGGFVGITGNEAALERFVITMPILSNIAETFNRYSSVKENEKNRQEHHEAFGNFFENQLKQSQNLINALANEGNPFLYPDLRNLTNFSVPSDEIHRSLLERDKNGEKLVKSFREQRMMENSTIPFWSTLQRTNMKTFADTEIKLNNAQKLVTSIKAEKLLFARMLAISRTRPELCPDKVIGDYEFTNIPPSNFHPDGRMITANPRSNVNLVSHIQKMSRTDLFEKRIQGDLVIIIDAWTLMNDMKKIQSVKNVSDLVNLFLAEVETVSRDASEVRLIFHPFAKNSLSEGDDRWKCSSTKLPVHYRVTNNTPMKNLDNFLAHKNTRIELASFLAKAAQKHFERSSIAFLVAYENKFAANRKLAEMCSMDLESGQHTLHTTNQLIVLNAMDVAKKNRDRDLTIISSNTDIVVQLIHFYEFLTTNTTVNISGQISSIGDLNSYLGEKHSKALFGWYSFQGMDGGCGSFRGKGLATQFRCFKKCNEDILKAFSDFGTSLEIPDEIIMQMEKFVCSLYATKNNSIKNIRDLRYMMSVKDGYDANRLPPTIGTLIPHVSRAYYQTLIGKLSIDPQPEIPDPTRYHWNLFNDNTYRPTMCINAANPAELLELKSCVCKSKNKPCSRMSCTCLKNGLHCCDICECGDNCDNQPAKTNDEIETNDDELNF